LNKAGSLESRSEASADRDSEYNEALNAMKQEIADGGKKVNGVRFQTQ